MPSDVKLIQILINKLPDKRCGEKWSSEARRAGCVTNVSASSRCCTKDGSSPPEADLHEWASNRPVLLRSKGVAVNNWGKDCRSGGQVGVEEMRESKPADDASLRVKKLPKVGSPPAP